MSKIEIVNKNNHKVCVLCDNQSTLNLNRAIVYIKRHLPKKKFKYVGPVNCTEIFTEYYVCDCCIVNPTTAYSELVRKVNRQKGIEISEVFKSEYKLSNLYHK